MNERSEYKHRLTADEKSDLITVLQARFDRNMQRHKNIEWQSVLNILQKNDKAIHSLQAMEATKGEPDVIENELDPTSFFFFDCSKQSPSGRRKLCYDDAALKSRKKYPPEDSATSVADKMGIELLSEGQYKILQKFGEFDTKTSSWIQTPDNIRNMGGALFCDRRYDTVFVYHNGAESYYASRGFRGVLKLPVS